MANVMVTPVHCSKRLLWLLRMVQYGGPPAHPPLPPDPPVTTHTGGNRSSVSMVVYVQTCRPVDRVGLTYYFVFTWSDDSAFRNCH